MWTLTLWEKLSGTTSTVCTGYGQCSQESCAQFESQLVSAVSVTKLRTSAATTIMTTAAWTCCWSALWRSLLKPWPVIPSRPRLAFTTHSGDTSGTPKRYELFQTRTWRGLLGRNPWIVWPFSTSSLFDTLLSEEWIVWLFKVSSFLPFFCFCF